MSDNQNSSDKTSGMPLKSYKLKCGIVMPISAIDGCDEKHWSEVKGILVDAIESTGFEANLVSDADDVGIIQKRIIQNLYDNPVIVCDVSGKNSNVMFELGMRLAFDKPTIIVKDDKTSDSFDTATIEHLEYPRDLRFGKMVLFKQMLCDKIKATHLKAKSDTSYTTFLKHFGRFTVAKLETTEVSKEDFILQELAELRKLIQRREAVWESSFIENLSNRPENSKWQRNTSRDNDHISTSTAGILNAVAREPIQKAITQILKETKQDQFTSLQIESVVTSIAKRIGVPEGTNQDEIYSHIRTEVLKHVA